MSWELSKEDTGRDVVVFQPAGVAERSEKIVVGKELEVGGVDMLLQLATRSAMAIRAGQRVNCKL